MIACEISESPQNLAAVNARNPFMPDMGDPASGTDWPRPRSPEIPSSLRHLFVSHDVQEMKWRRIEGNRHWLTLQALPDIHDHICAVRDEFTGSPEINFYHATLIIKIRRQNDLAESLEAFRILWDTEGRALLELLSSRWLISALDTFADHGKPQERTGAMAITTFFNMLRLADTEYLLAGDPTYDASKLDNNVKNCPMLWDGLRVFHLPDDDTFANMIKRMHKVLWPMPLFVLIFDALLKKAVRHDTILTRLARHHQRNLL